MKAVTDTKTYHEEKEEINFSTAEIGEAKESGNRHKHIDNPSVSGNCTNTHRSIPFANNNIKGNYIFIN